MTKSTRQEPVNLTRLRFRHVNLLAAIGRTRNLRLAAEQLHISQPAATKILSDVETMLGSRLFERLPRDMRPTDLGIFVLQYARASTSGLDKFVSEFSALRAGGYGRLAVGTIPAGSASYAVECTRRLLEKRPLLSLKLIEQSSDQLCVWLEGRQIDVMIGRMTEQRHEALFDFEALSAEPVAVVCGRDHPLMSKAHIDRQDLNEWPWILYPSSTAIRRLFDETFAGVSPRTGVGMVETSSIFSMLELLQVTNMISLQPFAVMRKYVERNLIGLLPLNMNRSMSHYGIITRKGEILNPIAIEFIDLLRAVRST